MYEDELAWVWRAPNSDGGVDLGDPAGFAFDPSLNALVRETGQNSSDERLPDHTVDLQYSVIELSGDPLSAFLSAMKWQSLLPHLEGASENYEKAQRVIRPGLDDIDNGKLLLIRVADFSATGLVGPEFEKGNFTAVARNTLDSQKSSRSSGGSFGLGKSIMWVCSRFGLVLMASHLSRPEQDRKHYRFIGKVALPFHRVGTEGFGGPGWFASPDSENPSAPRSYWEDERLARDLHLAREPRRPGTSFLIVGAFDPSGTAGDATSMVEQIKLSAATNFWPAMTSGSEEPRMRISVEHLRNGASVSSALIDPSSYPHVKAKVAMLRAYFEGETGDSIQSSGDVVKRAVTLQVPKCTAKNRTHPAREHEANLLIAKADEDDEEVDNRVIYFRGSRMVIMEEAVYGLGLGAMPFHAIVLAGEAAAEGNEAADAETFLRTAEPPEHNDWTETADLSASYASRPGEKIKEFKRAINKEIKEVVSKVVPGASDGPRALKDLLKLKAPGDKEREKRPEVSELTGEVDLDGAWRLDVTVKIPPKKRDQILRLRPRVKFSTESGGSLEVEWEKLSANSNCRIDGRSVVTQISRQTVSFSLRTKVSSHPIPSSRSRVQVDVDIEKTS